MTEYYRTQIENGDNEEFKWTSEIFKAKFQPDTALSFEHALVAMKNGKDCVLANHRFGMREGELKELMYFDDGWFPIGPVSFNNFYLLSNDWVVVND